MFTLAGIAGMGGYILAKAAPYRWRRMTSFVDPFKDASNTGYQSVQGLLALSHGHVLGDGIGTSIASYGFLPNAQTDFIFAVIGEEFGLLGQLLILSLYGVVIGRALYLSMQGQDTFTRLTGGAIALSFFVYVFVNSGMVSGILPVVGVPLPLISYGGTSMVTLLAGFGILMSLNSHRKLIGS